MKEAIELTPLPLDNISLTNEGVFQGKVYVYTETEGKLNPKEIPFDIPKRATLSPFYYSKPIVAPEDPFKNPPGQFIRDSQPREGYYPIVLIKDGLRPPNHLYEKDDAIYCAVNIGSDEEPNWETRYFPEQSIPKETWEEALTLLGIKK